MNEIIECFNLLTKPRIVIVIHQTSKPIHLKCITTCKKSKNYIAEGSLNDTRQLPLANNTELAS